jgi:hypothetical protein
MATKTISTKESSADARIRRTPTTVFVGSGIPGRLLSSSACVRFTERSHHGTENERGTEKFKTGQKRPPGLTKRRLQLPRTNGNKEPNEPTLKTQTDHPYTCRF